MATKWRGWTSHLAVKIICFMVMPVLLFSMLAGMFLMVKTIRNDTDILFTNFDNDQYFFESYANSTMYDALAIIQYQSKENIENMGCLRWEHIDYDAVSAAPSTASGRTIITYSDYADAYEENNYAVSWDGEEPGWYLVDRLWGNQWGPVGENRNSGEAQQLIRTAVNWQLDNFEEIWKQFQTMEQKGLVYYMRLGKATITNVKTPDKDFFTDQRVHLLMENGRVTEQSRDYANSYSRRNFDGYNTQDVTAYIGFGDEAVQAEAGLMRQRQQAAYQQVGLLALQALGGLVAFIVWLCGSGRKTATGKDKVYFTVLDKPWLDVGLALVIAVCSIGIAIEVESSYYFVQDSMYLDSFSYFTGYGNTGLTAVWMAAVVLSLYLPLIWWTTSLAKRVKAGQWWRHSLIYQGGKLAVRFARSLWAGVPLTLKAVAVTAALLFGMILGYDEPIFIFVTVAIFLLLALRFARRLYLVQTGARLAVQGFYDPPIPVKGGELGDIAQSINNISDGINKAVDEKMKSERLRTQLITNVSHDIRTPLTSLITYTDLLKEEGLDCEKATEYLEVLVQKGQRLKSLVEELFEAAKASTGNVDVTLEKLDLTALIRQCLGELDERVQASGLDFRLGLPDSAMVTADGKLIWRVMENLLSNVFKYAMPRSRVYIDVAEEKGEYRLDVKNISAHPLNMNPSELTERFTRGDEARGGEGSGLGLSIVQSFVFVQGGRFVLSIDGDLFKATVFLPKA